MRTAGLPMDDVWAHRVLHERGVKTYRMEGVPAEIGVLVGSLDLKHRSKEENYRPYLHLTGELRSITPTEPLPYAISQVTYSPGHGEKVDAFYEFDDQQLVALAAKGYFTDGFVVPEQVTGIEWELPAAVDVLVLAPSGMPTEGDAPVVFTRVHDIGGLEIDRESSGYDLAQYFAEHPADGARRTQTVVDERALLARSDAINSLFTQDELSLDAEAGRAGAAPGVQAEPVGDGVSERLQQVEAEIAAEAEQFRAGRERIEGTTENLYRERVAQPRPATEHKGEPLLERAPHVPEADLDLEVEERETRWQAGEPAASFEEHKRMVARRAADLDLDDFGEQGLGS
ncbi:hypothetical protein [Promicromonospora aerolata]|uniref:Uncharacterized protein n=1 Tax=Promicromonospora aerolata TaxID=195749 RepID=A0ABW4V4B4_9MICO